MNNIITYFIGSQILFVLITLFFRSGIIERGEINLSGAYTLQIFAIIFLVLGYAFNYLIYRKKTKTLDNKQEYQLRKKFKFWILFLLFFGLSVVIYMILAQYDYSISNYIKSLFFNSSIISQNREEAINTQDISGVLKMFNVTPLALYLYTFSLITFLKFDEKSYIQLKNLNKIALLACIIKTLFTLDRLTFMAIVIVNIYSSFGRIDKATIKKIFIVFIGIIILNFASAQRMNGKNLFSFFVMYFELGIVNLQEVMNTLVGHSFGYNTFLGPLIFIYRTFGYDWILNGTEVTYNWIWNPAQFFTSYIFMDFGYFYFIVFILLGYWIRKFEVFVKTERNKYAVSLYFLILFIVMTFTTVPFIRGVESWLAILLSLLTTKLFINKKGSSDSKN